MRILARLKALFGTSKEGWGDEFFDALHLQQIHKLKGETTMSEKIKLGDEVKDKVTGFQGVVVSKHKYLTGCARFGVQPPVGGDGKVPEAQVFDGPQLNLIQRGKVVLYQEGSEVPEPRKGGPRNDPMSRR